MSEQNTSAETGPACTVYYDGSCPLCQREISFYQGQEGSDAVRWHDLTAASTGADDLSDTDAMKRFHMRRADGTLVSGAQAFAEVMQTMPRLRLLGKALGTPPIVWLAEGGYRLFLTIRPLISRLTPPPAQRPRHDDA